MGRKDSFGAQTRRRESFGGIPPRKESVSTTLSYGGLYGPAGDGMGSGMMEALLGHPRWVGGWVMGGGWMGGGEG